jgi:transcriptional regulator with XRE-family HTH domain
MGVRARQDSKPRRRARSLPPVVDRALREAGEDVIAWRKLRNLTQAQLAERAAVGVNTLRRLEHGDGGITLENLLRILRILGVLDGFSRSLDPYESDVGRLRSDQQLPKRVRPRSLNGGQDG